VISVNPLPSSFSVGSLGEVFGSGTGAERSKVGATVKLAESAAKRAMNPRLEEPLPLSLSVRELQGNSTSQSDFAAYDYKF
jgi:hypothetical protein